MNGNKTRFAQPKTDGKGTANECRQVFSHRTFSIFAAQSLPAVKFRRIGRGKTMKRLLTAAWIITLILGATTMMNAQTANPSPSPDRRFTRVTVGGDAIVQAQPDTAHLSIAVVT